MDISAIRKDYTLKSLNISDVNTDPLDQFRAWFEEAVAAQVLEVNAMCISTLGLDGNPNARIVLLKELDHGFVFFTNYESEKGQEIQQSNAGAITFFWPELERQVRIKGKIEKVSPEESDKYFFSRPFGSQIGAWVSPQSRVLSSKEELSLRQIEVERKFLDEPMQRPRHWGGYRLLPHSIEFWQGRPSRLHDRVKYELKGENWEISILAP
ncbi:pyridoxamine 5'-phosphate oxidase [Algoriphagus halophytocola]|uniref:Pyridoxine/pyridoxamine 5'-phosphate oxidase n=1 Tax=Algoriphagus halophytocola TaxID=2991499 RepID=A0ABY6MI78_9BACT|nr:MULTISPECIES: pyridoxamine 5'-phosphate oxidase [unclassified Algoriphagus]UZD23498.1 pyridoxamine 5'-phosphate oxidase [Algoriphagus sp. TR-M5]WBL44792.1 pyridoxamine 5'-phosphate oxidase [Algoriphagus sp. TR-M9]